MVVGFHPFFDNPVRMSYVAGWAGMEDLVERLGDLAHAVGETRIIPAPWEPYYRECPSSRYGGAYEWAQGQLRNPESAALALALFPGEPEQIASKIGHANWLILSTKSESSRITRKLMLTEALELWETQANDWLQEIVETCARLGMETSVETLHWHALQALRPLAKDEPEDEQLEFAGAAPGSIRNRGFDKELLQMEGWTRDPGLVILPVDGKTHALTREILRLDMSGVALLRARKPARTIPWDAVTQIYLHEDVLTLEVRDEPALKVAGYKNPMQVLAVIQDCYKAATERLLQGVATRVIRNTA